MPESTADLADLSAAVLSATLDESADCIKVLDLDARLLSMNTGGQKTMEIEDFDVCRNLLWPEFWHGEDRLRVETALNLARSGERSTFEGQATTFRGTPRWWTVKVAPIFGAQGEVRRLLAVSRDITAQKQAELALSELNASLELQVAARTRELLAEQRRADLLAGLGDALQQAGTPSEVAERALALLGPVLGARSMLLIRLEGEQLLFPTVWGDTPAPILAFMTRPGLKLREAPLLQRSALTAEGVYLKNYLSDPETLRSFPDLAVGTEPIRTPDGQLAGFLVVWRPVSPWQPGERALMGRAAATLSLALERAKATARLEGQARSQDAFLAFTEAVGTQTDVLLLARQAIEVLLTFFPESQASFLARQDDRWEARAWSHDLGAQAGEQQVAGLFGSQPVAGRQVEAGQAVFVDRQNDGADRLFSGLAQAAFPLLVGGEVQWLLSICLQARVWVERDRAVVRAVGRGLNLALERAEGVKQLSARNQDLRRERTFLRSVLASLTEGVVACDEHGRLTLFNEAARHFHGLEASSLPPEEWAGHYDLYGGDGLTPLSTEQVPLFRAWQGEQLSEVEMVIRPKGGEARQLLASGQPMFAPDGQRLGAVVTMRDVTARMAAEHRLDTSHRELQQRNAELQAANEELAAFTYSASHDLRTPVRHVQSFAQLARRALAEDSPAQVARHLGFIEQAAQRMTTLIDAVVQLSGSTRADLRPGRVDLNVVLEGVRLELEQDLGTRRVRWEIGTLPLVWGDEALLRQALFNLLENALKFSRTRDQSVIEVWSEELPGSWNVFVRDNGVGFESRYGERLFGVFQRLHTDREFEGTGMGLATVRRIVLRHGGRVSASSPGEGATFGFTLPRGS